MMMKFLALSALLFGSAFAQSANIGYPASGASVSAGSNITVEVDRPNSLTGSQEVGIVIAIQSCPSSGCIAPTDYLGTVLYKGPFDPQYRSGAQGKPPHQNFTVTVPATFQKGTAQLALVHLSLVGAGPYPLFETNDVMIQVA